MRFSFSFSNLVIAALLIGLALVPTIANVIDEPFYVTLFSRTVILALAAVSLNLVLGYGGMVSFGHAVYLGLGAYTVGMGFYLSFEAGHEWAANGWLHLIGAAVVSGFFALLIGLVSLRTKGVYFIMITLAFAQMMYFVFVGMETLGGDDGVSLYQLSDFGSLMDLNDDVTLYYLSYGLLVASLYLVHRIVRSRFGMVMRGAKSNDTRMQAIGFPTYRYRLAGFVISGMICGIAGFLLANQTEFVSPSDMHWTRSGDLIVMVVLGGMGTLFGPLVGSVFFLIVEEVLSGYFAFWKMIFGPILIIIILFAKGGIMGMLQGLDARLSGKGGQDD